MRPPVFICGPHPPVTIVDGLALNRFFFAASLHRVRPASPSLLEHRKAVGLLLLAALCWSIGGVLVKSVAWPPFAISAGRSAPAALILLLLCRRNLRFTWSAPQIGAGVAYAATTTLFVAANKLTTAANAILLQYTAPVYVALFGFWLLGEPARPRDWAIVAVSLAGMSLFLLDGLRLQGLAGILLGMVSGVTFGAMILLLRKQKAGSPTESIIIGNTLAFLAGLPWLFRAPPLAPGGWLALAALGIVQLGLSYWWYTRAIRHVTALEGVLIPVLEPILNPLWVMLALGERPSGLAFAGGVLVVGASLTRALLSLQHR